MSEQVPANAAPVALKEWAAVIDALLQGRQIMLLRKGGIIEETREFQLVSPSFYLLPGYEHQREELLKEEARGLVAQTLKTWQPGQTYVTLRAYGRVTDDIEIRDQETLDLLRDQHVWTDRFAEERLRWKKRNPLHLLLVRVYRLADEAKVPLLPAYTGCKSWVRLASNPGLDGATPVLGDDAYEAAVGDVKRRLGLLH
ncbi:DUF1802 family protein [Paenibacillus sp. IB182496]|uniref:DUF1802 family protein n=1 Tax=Paenibacillus sabuli TaxID=2772509 RepID=A0A927BXM7_9BACL|nr:DUF1802 family protein [Paenibacillus sabuli]MBD2848242.1 DUF1802 family protein [Paenibacillus sabuli]